MLQIDHVYEFLSQIVFKDYQIIFLPNGFLPENVTGDFMDDLHVFNETVSSRSISEALRNVSLYVSAKVKS